MLAEWILEQTTDALIYASRDGMIARWNEAASRLFGYARDEALGQSLDLIIPEPLRGPHWKGFDAAMASGVTRLGGRPSLTRAAHKSGRKLYLEMSFALVKDDAGQVAGSVAIARDVTERVERERAARNASPPPSP
ncbi:PAS domain-containing protein [Paraburkholderia sp. B3]|uniref:PAS domain-containing protein n=1 Tax=Paraburkholderia sp. B3 TaxID=3134791 RepID=UPI003981CB13